MATLHRPTATRVLGVYKRQLEPTWDDRYQPGIRGEKGEKPSDSYSHIVQCPKFGRELHFLSNSELAAYLIGFYHPSVVGIQEQRVMFPTATPHPLTTFPLDQAPGLMPGFRGTVDVAKRLGHLERLKCVTFNDPKTPNQSRQLVIPFISDILWAVKKTNGQVYCVNWDIKARQQDFETPHGSTAPHEYLMPQAVRNKMARHEIEHFYYADAGIRTVRISGDMFDPKVINNLWDLLVHKIENQDLPEDVFEEVLSYIKPVKAANGSIFELAIRLSQKFHIDTFKACYYQAILRRKIKVNLFQPINSGYHFNDQGGSDILETYGHLFDEVEA